MALSIKDFMDVDFSLTDKEIAKKLKCSTGTVSRYRRIFGAKKTGYTPRRTIDFSGVDLSRPVKEIAAELGCNPHSVSLARVRAGLSRKRNIDFSKADWSKTNTSLAQEYGCTAETVWIARKRLGIPQRPRGRKKGGMSSGKKNGEAYTSYTVENPKRQDEKSVPIPLLCLRALMQRYPHAARKADIFRAEKGGGIPDWPAWCFLPIRGVSAIITDGRMMRMSMSQQADVWPLSATLAWRPSQDIVRFDTAVYDALGKTPLADDVPDDIFLRLPAWCIYIELHEEAWNGVFVHLEYDLTRKRPELRFLFLSKKDDTVPYMPVILPLGYGSISSGFKAFQHESEIGLKNLPQEFQDLYSSLYKYTKEKKETAAELVKTDSLVQHVLSLVLYLCSEHPEWRSHDSQDKAPHHAEPKKVKTGWRLFPPDRPRIWTVGEETGIRIRAGRAHGGGPHAGPCPHIRRAHWHSYWTGKKTWKEGETPVPQKILVKWLPPTPVNMREDEKDG